MNTNKSEWLANKQGFTFGPELQKHAPKYTRFDDTKSKSIKFTTIVKWIVCGFIGATIQHYYF